MSSLAFGVAVVRAQALPEPGVLLYGAVTNGATGAALTNGTVTFSFTNGANVAVVAAPVTNVNGQFLYVVEVPFETVMAGLTLSSNALSLPAGTTSVGRGATFNGTNATILAASGPAFGVAAADRGLQLRVDLQVTPSGAPETYEAWSTRFFGVPNADPSADPDSDGRTNLQEYQDGTSPADANSVTRSLAVVTSGSGAVARSPNQSSFLNGASVTLTAAPDPGFFFTGWTGGVTAGTNPLTLVMAQNVAVTANFSALSNTFAVLTNAQTVSELSLLTLTNRATNVTATSLRFALGANAMAGMAMEATNGVFTWTPTEAQGPSSNLVSVLVFDTNNPTTYATQQVVVLVTEVNTTPALAAVGNQTVAELTTLTVNLSATDADLPPNTLTYELVSGPVGLAVNGSSGVLTWSPTEAQGPNTNMITVRVVDNGTPSLSATQSFQVIVTEVNTAPILAAIGNQTVAELTTLTANLSATDADLPANTLTYELVSGPPGLSLNGTSGVLTWTPTEAQGPSTNTVTVRVVDNGVPSLSATQSFQVVVTEVNVAPVLAAVGNQTVAELATLTVNLSATDADLPANTLTFSLGAGAPAGTAVHPTTGVLTWTPTEAQGPSTNVLSIIVTDNGVPSLSATQSFQVIVTEVNTPPVLAGLGNQTVSEGSLLTFTASASDSDLPANALTYSLGVGTPAGATVHPTTGAFTWTPSEGQGPNTNVISVIVTDNGVPSLSATQSFQVIVTEVNTAPVLVAIGNQTVNEGSLLTFTASATDADLPANTLTFSLGAGAPTGANVHPSSGAFTWTPTEAQGPSTNTISVIVTDNGAPSLSATQSFQVIVSEVNAAPALAAIGNQTVNEGSLLTFSASASDADLPANILTFSLGAGAPVGASMHSTSGVFTWTPTEAQGPSTNTISLIVVDNGTPSLSATQSFQVIVSEVNTAPVLAAVGNRTVAEQTMLTVNLSATEADFPANTLTYEIVSGPGGVAVNGASGVLTWTPSEAQGPSTNTVIVRVVDNGTPSLSATQSLQVIVTEVNTAPMLISPATATIKELTTLMITNLTVDADLPANGLSFALVSAPVGVSLDASTGLLTWTPTAAQGPNTNNIVLKVTDNGAPPLSTTNTIAVIVDENNSAPVLQPIAPQFATEGSLLVVTNFATDGDIPANILAFTLLSGPAGATLDSVTGVFRWTPGELDGPGTNTVTVKVADNASPPLSTTNSFTVVVSELNTSPVFGALATNVFAVNELTTLTITNTASDVDLPANTLTFGLGAGAPAGATVHPTTGVFAWTPTEVQGPSTNTISIFVTDNGVPSLSATQSFQVIVTEVNTVPVLAAVGTQAVAELTTLTVNLSATDADLPANTLTYEIVNGPTGVAVDAASGVFTWTPTETQGPNTNTITVRVVDNGVPSLSATQSFQIIVTEVNTAPMLATIGNQMVAELTTLTFTSVATDGDLPANTLNFSLGAGAPAGASVNPSSGMFTWAPTEAQGPSTNVLSIIVMDNGVPSLSSTQSFQVIVTEVNTAPVLAAVGNQTVAEQTALNLTLSGSDTDLPAQALTYELVSGPTGLSLNGTSGALTWTPTEAQGPSTNTVTVLVVDNGVPSLSATQSFQVIVAEVNTAPVLAAVGNQSLNAGELLSISLIGTDVDLPTNPLGYALVSGPAGMAVNATSGLLTWVPTSGQASTTNFVVVQVTDSGLPTMSATQSFFVVVAALPLPQILSLLPTNQVVLARTNSASVLPVSFTVSATNAASYQWSFAGTTIPGETGATLLISDARRMNNGVYSVAVTGPGGSMTTNATLHVIVPQRVQTVQRLADGTVRLLFRDDDAGLPTDLARLEVHSTTNLRPPLVWTTNVSSLVFTNGLVQFEESSAGGTRKFYRILER